MATPLDTRGPLIRSAVLRWIFELYTERLTQAGRWFLWPTIAFLSFTSTSPQLPVYVASCYAAGIWVVALASLWIFRPRVGLRARHADRACAGEVLPIDVEVEQRGRLGGIDLRVGLLRPPASVGLEPPDGAPLPYLARGEKARVRLGLRCERRGAHRLAGLSVQTVFPLGLLAAARPFSEERSLLIYPRFRALARLRLPAGRNYQPGGVALASSLGDAAEFVGDREWRDGDSVRDIDWRASARLDRLVVREYRQEYFVRVVLILDTHVPPPGKGRGAAAVERRREDFERAVSICAAVGDWLARQEYLVDILAAGPSLYHLTAGRSLAYLDQILDILACVEESGVEGFDRIEPELSENLAQISAVVAVFLDWSEARRQLVEKLRRQGVGVKVILACDGRRPELDPAADADLIGDVPVISRADFEAGVEEL